MAQIKTSSQLVADLDRAIERVEAEARSLAAQAPTAGAVRGGAAGALEKTAGGEAKPSLEDLTVFLSRLKQMKEWLQEDARLLPVVDGVIGQHVKAAEKRANALNVQIAVITTLVGALLGWLLSSVQGPASLLSQVSQVFNH
jgi:hypothetical protein